MTVNPDDVRTVRATVSRLWATGPNPPSADEEAAAIVAALTPIITARVLAEHNLTEEK